MGASLTSGTILSVKTDGTGTAPVDYSAVAGVKTLGAVGFSTEEIEVTPVSSTSREYIAGLKTPSSIELVLYYDETDAMHGYLKADAEAGHTIPVQIDYTSGVVANFNAVVLGFELNSIDGNSPDAQTATVNLRTSGTITWS